MGDPVIIDADPDLHEYIFQFQTQGVIASEPQPGHFMIRLYSAVGLWGPMPADRLKLDRRRA